ncbi:class I SAM-dependent methyltransferase [Sphaerospermopsis aphanizomenoides BCCUSP55]|uniref:class I SAM-dependent methyltransferase n=1 Tax=Sphaerospermopsis aphanizomenoides TaxID=459663 RepID=UPI001903F88E|nr:class I SAM-dependent methyltransferase [Sphaerospermopsis aphanizomenoides]MBK1986068.1 class I SAM-dependent methyltransferase [Sphaerospermopsis aphanizomenoides BCCUSP55]
MTNKEDMLVRTEAIFNSASDNFDAPALSFWNRFGQRTIDRLALRNGDRVLDVCCGTGASAIPAALSVGSTGKVLGIDIAESLLQLGRNKSKQQCLENIEFQYGDFQNLGLPNESFDAIVCVFGIFFVPDMVAAIRELWRMVRPGGKLAITSWGKDVFEPANQIFWNAVEAERPDLVKKFTPWDRISDPASLQALLEAGGATQVEVFAEAGIHELTSPEDWWTMVLGGGLRGTIDQLDPVVRERVRQANVRFLQANEVHALKVNVLYAIAQKQ